MEKDSEGNEVRERRLQLKGDRKQGVMEVSEGEKGGQWKRTYESAMIIDWGPLSGSGFGFANTIPVHSGDARYV